MTNGEKRHHLLSIAAIRKGCFFWPVRKRRTINKTAYFLTEERKT